MKKRFEVLYSEKVLEFLSNLEEKVRDKIVYNIDKSSYLTDPELFKKLTGEIWEFRTKYNKNQYRLLAFWDKEDDELTLVIVSHGYIKKTSKVNKQEILKAEKVKEKYFEMK